MKRNERGGSGRKRGAAASGTSSSELSAPVSDGALFVLAAAADAWYREMPQRHPPQIERGGIDADHRHLKNLIDGLVTKPAGTLDTMQES